MRHDYGIAISDTHGCRCWLMLEPITFVLEQISAIAIIQPPRPLRLSYDAKQTLEIVQEQGGTGVQMSY